MLLKQVVLRRPLHSARYLAVPVLGSSTQQVHPACPEVYSYSRSRHGCTVAVQPDTSEMVILTHPQQLQDQQWQRANVCSSLKQHENIGIGCSSDLPVRWKCNSKDDVLMNGLSLLCKEDIITSFHITTNVNTTDNIAGQCLCKNILNNSVMVRSPGLLGVSGLSLFRSNFLQHQKISPSMIFNCKNKYKADLFDIIQREFVPTLSESNISNIYSKEFTSHSISNRFYHTSSIVYSSEPSSQVEITVNDLKEKAKAKKEEIEKKEAETPGKPEPPATKDEPAGSVVAPMGVTQPLQHAVASTATPAVVQKKTVWMRVKEEIGHYYHGFRLLFIDTKICIKYCYRVLNGEKLSRREHRQLVRTTGDLFRLLPFSVFIIVPFMELLLPVAIKLFPGMLPSTFETANEKEAKIKKHLKVKLEMAKFLQETLDSMALQSKGHWSQSAKDFVLFFEKVHRTGEPVSNEEILKFSKLFADNITLDSLSRPQLTALCRLLEMQPFGTNNFLRFQLRLKLRSLVADDKLIAVEGVESLSSWELQQACRLRGMRAYGMTDERLRHQLRQWLELSLDQKVPQSLLLLSRTLYLPDDIDPNTSLAATISQLPEEVKTLTKAAIGKREGKIDNRTRFQVIQTEEKMIKEDKKDMEDEKKKKMVVEAKKKAELGVAEDMSVGAPSGPDSVTAPPLTAEAMVAEAIKITKATVTTAGEIKEDKEVLVDRAPVLEDTAPVLSADTVEVKTKQVDHELSTEDLAEVEEALETIGAKQRRLLIEEQELSELKEEMKDYQDDIEDFKQVVAQFPETGEHLSESVAARRLFSKVNKLIAKTEPLIAALNAEARALQKVMDAGQADTEHRATLVNLEDLVSHLRQVAEAPDSAKLTVIRDVLTAMDTDNDGAIKLEHILKALELLSEDQVGVPRTLFEEAVLSMAKQEQLETKTVVQNAISASKVASPGVSTAADSNADRGDVSIPAGDGGEGDLSDKKTTVS